jgi:hypothetical protein
MGTICMPFTIRPLLRLELFERTTTSLPQYYYGLVAVTERRSFVARGWLVLACSIHPYCQQHCSVCCLATPIQYVVQTVNSGGWYFSRCGTQKKPRSQGQQ